MTATTRMFEAVDAVVTILRDAGLKYKGEDLPVYDGPNVSATNIPGIYVGYDGNPQGDFRAVRPRSQEWGSALGAKARDEEFFIICAITALAGENNVKRSRDLIAELYESIAQAINDKPDLDLPAPRPFTAGCRPGDLAFEPNEVGLIGRLAFFIDVKCRTS